jgi:hypothetical protein
MGLKINRWGGLSKQVAKSGSVLNKIYSIANINNLENKKYIKYFICAYETRVFGIMTLKLVSKYCEDVNWIKMAQDEVEW